MKQFNNRAWIGLIPALSILCFVGLIPLVTVFNYSFYDIFTLESKFWVGPEWYRDILTSTRFYESLGRSLMFSAIVIGVQFPLGILIALLLPRTGWVRVLMIILLAIPLVVPWNMIPAMWLSLLNPETGLIGMSAEALGVEIDYKFNALHTWILLVVMDSWHWIGLVAILSYSSLASIPGSYYQAAAIDGASRWQVFCFVQLPKMSGVLLMALLLRFMDSFMIYTEAFGINAGGPFSKTTFLSLDLGEEIKAFSYGSAAARSVIYFIIVLSVAWAFKTLMRAGKEETA